MTIIEGYDQNGVSELWDDDTRTYTNLRDLRDGMPVSRPYTAEENAQANARAATLSRATNETTLHTAADAALQGDRDFLALDPPTTAQVLAQVKALTRQNIGLIRLALRDFTDTG